MEGDVSALARLLSVTPSFAALLADPTASADHKRELASEAAKRLGSSVLVSNLLSALGDAGRLGAVPALCAEFSRLAAAAAGGDSAVVTTFEPLDAAGEAAVRRAVAAAVGVADADALQCEFKLDARLMGGMIVEVGDKLIDLSTRTRLRGVAAALESL